MAQRQVVEVCCCRCDRKEYREAVGDHSPGAAFTALLNVDEVLHVNFEDLCSPCANTVRGHLSQIARKIEGVSPVREKKPASTPKPVTVAKKKEA